MKFLFSTPASRPSGAALFLDRDGVINRRIVGDYVRRWEQFEFLPGALDVLRGLAELSLPIFVVSNQAGVAKGLISEAELRHLTEELHRAVAANGGRIDAVYYCPHHPDAKCACRKPAPGLLHEAKREWNLRLDRCLMVGDSESDVLAASAAGCRPILINSANDVELRRLPRDVAVVPDLKSAARVVFEFGDSGPEHPLRNGGQKTLF